MGRRYGWGEDEIRDVVREVTGVGQAPRESAVSKDWWKWLAGLLVTLLLGLVVTALTDSQEACAQAKAALSEAAKNSDRKLGKEAASDKYFPAKEGVVLQESVRQIRVTQEKHGSILREILDRLPKKRR